MPQLRRQPFIREQPPANLKPSDDVFYCKITKEVFTDYEKFFERTILCNSLVWTCAYTGHPGLTFQEALDSEQKAKDQLAVFPSNLKCPLLFVATLTHRTRLNDMNDDVYLFAKDRYFIGETVDVVIGNEKKTGTVIEVISSGICDKNDGDKKKSFGSDPSGFKYTVKLDSSNLTHTLDSHKVGRPRHVLTRDRCKLFLKKHCYSDSNGVWCAKPKYCRQFQLQDGNFISVCGGEVPVFVASQAKKRKSNRPVSDSEHEHCNGLSSDEDGFCNENVTAQKHKKSQQQKRKDMASEREEPKAKKPKVDKDQLKKAEDELKAMKNKAVEKAEMKEKVKEEKLAAKQAKKDELKKKADEEKEQRRMEKTKIKEEKKQQEMIMKQWNRIREDMELDDLRDLPVATPVNSYIPSESFGPALCVLEFIVNFQSVFDYDIPTDLSFGDFSQAMLSNEVDGLFYEILKEIMCAIFRHKDDEEMNALDDDDKPKEVAESQTREVTSKSSREVVKLATVCSQWPVLNLATPLHKLQLDSFTVSEIVRLHLLGSGCERALVSARFDYQQRGGYAAIDDPALDFRRTEAELLEQLAKKNIFDLSAGDKVKILAVLVNQLLTFAVCRDYIEECAEKLKQVQRDLRTHQTKESRRERDEVQYWWKKKMDDRMKNQEQGATANGINSAQNECTSSVDVEEKSREPKEDQRKRGRGKKQESNEKDYDSMPVENIDWDKISPEERQNMKDWAKKRELELSEEICELEFSCNIMPIGRDRTFRRYWVFRSTPGLFIEDDEQHIPDDFFEPALQNLSSVNNASLNTSHGKNEISNSSIKMEVGDENGDSSNVCGEALTMSVQEQIASRNNVRWSVLVSKTSIEQLIESLNPRGFRESKLRQVISEQRDLIFELVAKCEFAAFCDLNIDNKNSEIHVSKESSAQKSLEENFRDSLLDIEERIFSGTLGTLKVDSRMEWRSAISNFSYNPQCETLTFGGSQTIAVRPTINSTSVLPGSNGSSTTDTLPKSEVSNSVVRDLALALLQIEQMLESKYLNPPLGENEETKKQKQKAFIEAAFKASQKTKDEDSITENVMINGDNSDDETGSVHGSAAEEGISRLRRQRSPIERWEESLMLSTSLSQLFVHLSVLDMSVTWSRSSLHAYCRICRRKGDGEHMLLCDGCDRGHHMYCLKPPMKYVPEGDWFCPSCRPKEVVHVQRTPRKTFEVSSDSDSEDDNTEIDDAVDDSSDAENETVLEEINTDTEIYANTTEDDMSSVSRSTKASARRSGNSVNYATPPSHLLAAGSYKTSNGGLESGSLGRGARSKVQTSRAASERDSQKATSSRNSVAPRGVLNGRPSNERRSLEPRRKLSADWNDYEVDSKRLSLSTKSRSGEIESGLKAGQELINELIHNDDAWPFLRPVTKKEASDYFDIIKQPMDFSTVRNKLNRFEYANVDEMLDDVRLIFSNCAIYNLSNSIVAMAGQQLEQHFERRVRQLKLASTKRNSVGAGVNQSMSKSQMATNRKRTL